LALTWQLAYRYLRGKRTANAVPILSRISMVAIGVSSAAMIIVISVVNGLNSFVKDQYKAFYPDVKISVARGKFFSMDSTVLKKIEQVNGVHYVSRVIEDNAFAIFNDQQKVIFLKGVDDNYFHVNDIRQYIVRGDSNVSAEPSAGEAAPRTNKAILGKDVINELGTDVNALMYFTLNYPNPTITNPGENPLAAFQSIRLYPVGVFRILDEFDSKYILAPLPLAQELFHRAGNYSSIEISADTGDIKKTQQQLKNIVGSGYKVETRYEQNKTLFMVMASEKWAVYAILLLVLLIASFNMVGALSMVVLEKQKDIAILKAMGANAGTIRNIFLLEGVLWSLIGGVLGIVLGCGICVLQQKFKIIKMGQSFFVDSFPVEIQFKDTVLVFATVLAVGLLMAWYPAIRATKTIDPSLKST
jgi:lipoprotein-releasing system permease protein